MSRYLNSKSKIFSRLGLLYGFNHSKNLIKKQKKLENIKDYSKILIKKQKIRFLYGLTQTQLKNILKKKKTTIFKLLEKRFDCVLFRLGFAKSIPAARQLILHKHFCINNKVVTFPNYTCEVNDIISISRLSPITNTIVENFQTFQYKKILNTKIFKIFKSLNTLNFNCFPMNFKLNSYNNSTVTMVGNPTL